MQRRTVTIIGMGPRGLSVFERIAAIAGRHRLPFDIHVIDPGDCGAGVHLRRQPAHLLINTLASQVTMFPAPGAVAHAPLCEPLSLTEWARRSDDYLPRGVLGEYLHWVYRQIETALPSFITLTHHRQRAVDLWRRDDGRLVVALADGAVVGDAVFLTTGHGGTSAGDPYPVERLSGIAAGARVAIQGLGLSAHDVIAELTVGRGGRFSADGYHRSGREPHMLLSSRSGMPNAARGINQKGLDGRHQPHFFTLEAVERLRRQALISRGGSQLDFERELLPLLKQEMAWVYRCTQQGSLIAPSTFRMGAGDEALIDRLLFPQPAGQDFRAGFINWLRTDLAEARRGNLSSPVKAATDVLRDVRSILQAAIEHGGLTPASHRRFLQLYHPAINRAAYGPPLRRNEELLALLDAGVIDIVAPGVEVIADAVVIARVASFLPELDTSLLIRNVLKRGLAQPYRNGDFHPGGLAINRDCRLIDAGGRPAPDIWVQGYPAEGAHYYTHALPRPGMRSRQVLDAELCVTAMCGLSVTQRTDMSLKNDILLESR